MQFHGTADQGSTPLKFSTALISWLPIAISLVLGTLLRAAVLVLGGTEHGAAVASILCAGAGAALAALWFTSSTEAGDWWTTWKLSALWVVLTIAFRALWLGVVVGAGWNGVALDYQVWDGKPGAVVVAVVAAAPFVLKGRRRVVGSDRFRGQRPG